MTKPKSASKKKAKGSSKLRIASLNTSILDIIGFSFCLAWTFLLLMPSTYLRLPVSGLVVCVLAGELFSCFVVYVLSRKLVSNYSIRAVVIFVFFASLALLIVVLVLALDTPKLQVVWFCWGTIATMLIALWGIDIIRSKSKASYSLSVTSFVVAFLVIIFTLFFLKQEAAIIVILFLPVASAALFMVANYKTMTEITKHSFFEPEYLTKKHRNLNYFIQAQCAIFAHSILLGFSFGTVAISESAITGIVVFLAAFAASVFKIIDCRGLQRYEVSNSIKLIGPAAASLLLLPYVSPLFRMVIIVVLVIVGTLGEILTWMALSKKMRTDRLLPFENLSLSRIGPIVGLGVGYAIAYFTTNSLFPYGEIHISLALAVVIILIIILQVFMFTDHYSQLMDKYDSSRLDSDYTGIDAPPPERSLV
jgi:hypothetical protein